MEDPGNITSPIPPSLTKHKHKLTKPHTRSPGNRRRDPVPNSNTTFHPKIHNREILHERCILHTSLLSNGLFLHQRNGQFEEFDTGDL